MDSLLINLGVVASLLLLYSVFVFILARLTHDNSVMDIAYGPAFFVSTAGALYITETFALLPGLVVACIGGWAVRLGSRILLKNIGKPEDHRYAKWREEWMQKGKAYFIIRSYLQVNLLQIIIILIVALPAVLALSYPEYLVPEVAIIGLMIFAVGLMYESIADMQLDAFLKRKRAGTEPATLMQQGLFKYSRRPNYFGETLVWWGLAIMVLPLPFGYLALLSPLMITYIVTKVTGPMLERAFLERYPEEYGIYMETTNYFIPGKPKVLPVESE